MCNYHVGETVLSLQKATLIPGGSESLVYTTLSGGIGMLVPFTSREVGITFAFLCVALLTSFLNRADHCLPNKISDPLNDCNRRV